MRIALFYHSLLSDWNHGNAHFLRGYATELLTRGHDLRIFEPENNWSLSNLLQEHGPDGLLPFRNTYGQLQSRSYTPETLDLDAALDGVNLVIAHEWNDHDLIARLGRYRDGHPDLRLLFHDTHHRAASKPEEMARYDLSAFDGALVYGEVLRATYLERGWTAQAWTWHEAADTRVFHPIPGVEPEGDLVWIGNWGDDERTRELHEFLIEPVKRLGLRATVYGVRYPKEALDALADAGITFGGWLSNAAAPSAFSRHRLTVHIPRRYYTRALPGIPTIRVFEALACCIPLISAPWPDSERLFCPGDYAVADSGDEMIERIRYLLDNPKNRAAQAQCGLATVLSRHTCAHRVDQLLAIAASLGLDAAPIQPASTANAPQESAA